MNLEANAARATDASRRVANSGWARGAARFGFVARGVVYLIIGVLAVQIALHKDSGQKANKQGALEEIGAKSYGKFLLVVMAIGLAAYCLWRFSDAIWGHRDETDDKKRTAKRLGSAGKGAIYVGFLLSTISVLGGKKTNGNETQQKTWTAKVLGWPGGTFIVAVAGLVVIGAGLYLMYRGVTKKFEKHLDTASMSQGTKKATDVLGMAGNVGRGLVAVFAGGLFVKAAADHNPDDAKGIDGTLRTIAEQSYGQVLLVVAAVGLFLFGVYSFFEARYRQL